ncbi:MAG: hypothetical protein GY788_13845 [bacterium]|nr:hypothetical protein [bacterium]
MPEPCVPDPDPERGLAEKLKAWLKEHGPGFLKKHWATLAGGIKRLVLVVPLAWFLISLVENGFNDETKSRLVVLLIVLGVVLIFFPSAIREFPIKKLKLWEVEVELGDGGGEDEGDLRSLPTASSQADRWRRARWRLEMKLTYLGKHTLPDHLPFVDNDWNEQGGGRPELSIGSLKYDRLLEEEDAVVATTLLSLSPTDLQLLRERSLDDVLDSGERLAGTLRLRVFKLLVVKYGNHRGWCLDAPGQARAICFTSSGKDFRLWPIFAKGNADLVQRRVKEISRMESSRCDIVVLPRWPGQDPTYSQPSSGKRPWVVSLDLLEAAVSRGCPAATA